MVEVFKFNKFSNKSDVWAFGKLDIWKEFDSFLGISLWEIMEYGSFPYPDMNNDTARKRVLKGYRMPKPDICEEQVYLLMLDCWNGRSLFPH